MMPLNSRQLQPCSVSPYFIYDSSAQRVLNHVPILKEQNIASYLNANVSSAQLGEYIFPTHFQAVRTKRIVQSLWTTVTVLEAIETNGLACTGKARNKSMPIVARRRREPVSSPKAAVARRVAFSLHVFCTPFSLVKWQAILRCHAVRFSVSLSLSLSHFRLL